MAVKSRPSAVSRVSVAVVLLLRMSTSPDCSAVKRCCAVRGVYFTFSASPKMAAATARQTSTSSPTHLPWLSASMKPAVPVPTPQISVPRALMASRSLPAMALPDATIAITPAVAASEYLNIIASRLLPLSPSLPSRGQASNRPNGRSIGRGGSAYRWGVLQTALAPQLVQAALDLERAARADIALEGFAVIPALLDDGVDPLLVDPERLAHAGGD